MRSLLATVTFAVLLGASAAQAEKRIFIVANNADGYGVDRCLAAGDKCGTAAATAYCKSREFAQASSFRKVDKDEITGAVPTNSRRLQGRQLRPIRRHRVHALRRRICRCRAAGIRRCELTCATPAHLIEFAAAST